MKTPNEPTTPKAGTGPPSTRLTRPPRKAQVRQPDISADLALTRRQEQQRQSVERFNHRTFRTDWNPMVNDLFARIVDGCPFAVGLFTEDDSWSVPRLRSMLNFNGAREQMLYYVRRHFKLRHYRHITSSLEGLAPHERFDLYKIVSSGLGLPLNSLVYKIEHYNEPERKAVIIFGGERLGGQMEVHLKMTASLLERAPTVLFSEKAQSSGESRYAQLIAMLRAADPRKLRQAGLNDRAWTQVHEIVTGLEGVQDQFPEMLKTKFVMLSKLLEEVPKHDPRDAKPPAPLKKDSK